MTLSRRQFVQHLASAGLASSGALSSAAFARSASGSTVNAQTAFASSFTDVPNQYGPTKIAFDRPLPSGLTGTLYRNGPAKMVRGSTQMQHWFDGDGMINAFRFDDKHLHHQGKMVKTRRFEAEEKAGRYLWNGFGTTFPDARPVSSPDAMNPANISVLPVQDSVLALWEAGSPWRIDPNSLETIGRHVFSADTDGMPFSAHPRVDPDGRIWNFGYLTGSGKLVLYDLSKTGKLNRVSLIDEPESNMVHDFAVTDRHLVFVLMPFDADESNNGTPRSFMDRLSWRPDAPVIALVIEKESLKVVRRFEVDPFFAFHFGNAWHDGDDIKVQVARAPKFDALMQSIMAATTGSEQPQLPDESAMLLTLNLKTGAVSTTDLPVTGADFPRYDQRFTGLHTSDLFMLGQTNHSEGLSFGVNQLLHIDAKSERVQQFDFGANMLVEEHVFVAKGSKPGDGWLVGTAYDWQAGHTVMSVFNARHIKDGPISQATLPYSLPLGLHGQFVPA